MSEAESRVKRVGNKEAQNKVRGHRAKKITLENKQCSASQSSASTHPKFGVHSIQSGTAMAMHLDNVPTYAIVLEGSWSSDAFLDLAPIAGPH